MHHHIPLSFTKPPLNANQRMHWAKKSSITQNIRREAKLRSKSQKIPEQTHITIELHYRPADNRRRDPSNLMPTQKALVDGVVDAGVVEDDTPQFVTERMPTIHPAAKGEPACMWMTIIEGAHPMSADKNTPSTTVEERAVQVPMTTMGEAPRKATPGAAGFDLAAAHSETIPVNGRRTINTSVRIAIPTNHVGLLFSRSGWGMKHGVALANGVGVIDSDYRGDIRLVLANWGEKPINIQPGDRVGQLVIIPTTPTELVEVGALDDTVRGEGGFGSTGTK